MVYLIICDESKTCKIGYSGDPDTRLIGIQGSRTTPLRLHAVISGDMKQEKAIHKKFSHLRLSGEWFTIDSSILKYFDQRKLEFYKDMVKKPGRPPASIKTTRRVLYLPEHYDKTNAEIVAILLSQKEGATVEAKPTSQVFNEAWVLVEKVFSKVKNKDYALSRLRTWAETTVR